MGNFSTLDLKVGMLHKENHFILACKKALFFLQKWCSDIFKNT